MSEEVLVGTVIGVGGGGGGGRNRTILNTTLHCHHQNDSCIKVGGGVSHSNVSIIVRGKVAKTVTTIKFNNLNSFEEKGEPKRDRTEVLLLTSLTAKPEWLRKSKGTGHRPIFFVDQV